MEGLSGILCSLLIFEWKNCSAIIQKHTTRIDSNKDLVKIASAVRAVRSDEKMDPRKKSSTYSADMSAFMACRFREHMVKHDDRQPDLRESCGNGEENCEKSFHLCKLFVQ